MLYNIYKYNTFPLNLITIELKKQYIQSIY